jgi:hypothetical protein
MGLYMIVHWVSVAPCKRQIDSHRCLHTQSREYKQLRMYNRKDSLLYGVIITAILT